MTRIARFRIPVLRQQPNACQLLIPMGQMFMSQTNTSNWGIKLNLQPMDRQPSLSSSQEKLTITYLET